MNNPSLTIDYIEQNQLTSNLFELWINLIAEMKYEFEWRRSMMGFLSIFLLDYTKLNSILANNFPFILGRILFFGKKLIDNYNFKKLTNTNNLIEAEEVIIFFIFKAEVSGDDESEENMFTNYDEKQTKEMLKNFIEDDLDCDDEDEDEDYDEMKDFNFENEKKTNMEKKDEFVYFREVMGNLANTNNNLYQTIVNSLNGQEKFVYNLIINFNC